MADRFRLSENPIVAGTVGLAILKTLKLGNTRVTEAGAEALRKVSPGVSIEMRSQAQRRDLERM